jgi:N-acetylneuraminic acid mutarotase
MQTFKFDWLIDFGDPPPPPEFTYDLPLTFDEITAGATLTKGLQMFVIEDSDTPSPASATSNKIIPLPVDGKIATLARSQSAASVFKRQESKSDLVMPETRAIYVAGGSDETMTLNSVERFDVTSGTWDPITPLSSKRTDVALAGSPDGKLYAVGGTDDSVILTSVERFDSVTNRWTKLADMTTKRQCAGAVVADNKLFVVGGHDGVSPISTVEMYDPLQNRWKKMAEMAFKRQSGGVAVLENKIFALGGTDSKEKLSSLYCY